MMKHFVFAMLFLGVWNSSVGEVHSLNVSPTVGMVSETDTASVDGKQSYEICDGLDVFDSFRCEALVALYHSTDGDNWISNDGWLDGYRPCGWYGVSCDFTNEIYRLDLSNNNLVGTIPPELARLTFDNYLGLGDLVLSDNKLTGSIPPELGYMDANLIDLSSNQLTGSIPQELARLTGSTYLQGINGITLDFSHNQLTGQIPAELGQMVKEGSVNWDFSDNQLTGTVPLGLVGTDDERQLLSFDMSNNQLSGPLPEDFSGSRIRELYFDGTAICEPEGAAFQFWLDNVEDLRSTEKSCICDNVGLQDITSVECDALVALFNASDGINWAQKSNWLETLDPCNWFGVTCSAGKVAEIDLAGNGLEGILHSAVGNLIGLQRFHLQQNQLYLSLPQRLVNLTGLSDFRFDDTLLCEPENAQFQKWLSGIPSVQGTEVTCQLIYYPVIIK